MWAEDRFSGYVWEPHRFQVELHHRRCSAEAYPLEITAGVKLSVSLRVRAASEPLQRHRRVDSRFSEQLAQHLEVFERVAFGGV